MEKTIREFSGRAISAEEIELIQWTVKTYPQLSVPELAKTICEFLDWKQINGKPKTIPSQSLLKKLDKEGLIQLKTEARASKTRLRAPVAGIKGQSDVSLGETTALPLTASQNSEANGNKDGRHEEIYKCGAIKLSIAESAAEKKQWAAYVRQYHMLGCKTVFGAQIRYFIRGDGQDLGCLQFSASAWSLAARDKWIGWTTAEKKARLHLIVGNSRFLVLPWARVRNMASRALSLAERRIGEDWLNEYKYEPVLLETFVDTAYYKGTCYKAANWAYLGQTQGRGRNDRRHERPVTEKAVYVRPLCRSFREILKGEKAFKAVAPNE